MKFNVKKINRALAFNFAKKTSRHDKMAAVLKNKKILIIVIIFCLLLITCLFVSWYQLKIPLSKSAEEKTFIIKEGQGLEEIANNLEKEKIIRSEWIFVMYAWLQNKASNLQAGEYSLSSSMNISEITKKIIGGGIIPKGIKITIPEGFSNRQIEEKLIDLGILIENDKFPKDLEGYLFPDTYYFEKNSFIEEIVKKMRANFNRKITEDLKAEIKNQNKNLYSILIMASLLEKEVKTDEDKAIVSGIFWKRLENNYPLQSCATIAYILGVDKWRYSREDTKIKSPYNTYLNIGLPPAPINNPGLSTIKAAIYPKKTDYNFFLTDPETGKTIFSKTLEEHNANKNKYF